MAEWLTNEFGMRFYYWTGLSWLILFPVYLVGAGLITLLWVWLARRIKGSWAIAVPLYAALVIAPWVEELWIAWNFGHLCRKDAGIFIYQTVEVEGFYDATRPTTPVPRTDQAAADLDRGGYRFYEMVYPDFQGGRSKVVHLEKINGVWTPTVLDRPTARYHYKWPHSHTPVAHKVVKHERVVFDTKTNKVLGRDLEYGRKASWFFLGLDRPVMLCPTHDPLAKYGSIYKQTLRPIVEK